ncbi:MAG: extracellular solute-binding protein [Anaerolineales bacterium]|jgi:ABC-type glycerol-3-phosphate transport system substrate-binding protein
MRRFLTFVLLLLLLTGCAEIESLFSTPEPATVPTATSTPKATLTPTASPTNTPGGPRTLRIWVSPQFDPSAETAAATLLQDRLDEFVARRPNLQLEVRVKTDDSLINTLTTTRSAAPAVMPDLVALSRANLESATAKGLLHPLDGLTTLLDDPDWYAYARQMAHIQNTTFGLPFAGDALVLVGYRSPLPSDWENLSEISDETLFIFPAANPRSLFTLSLYLSAGGALQDNQGNLVLDENILTEILSLYSPDTESPFISPQVVNYETDEQAWNAFREQRGNLVVSWASRFLNEDTLPLVIGSLPGLETGQYTLATGWSWALAGSNPENQPLAIELADFLSDSEFLAEWTQAAGYLPTRPTALSSWDEAEEQMVLTQTAEAAALIPGEEILVTVGPLFSEATLAVINGEQLPAEAAQSVFEQLQ